MRPVLWTTPSAAIVKPPLTATDEQAVGLHTTTGERLHHVFAILRVNDYGFRNGNAYLNNPTD